MELQLRLYPDPVLLKAAAPIEVFDEALAEKVARMWEIMYESKGVGLAAPQVGWSAQLFIQNPTGDKEDDSESQVIINPKITKRWGKSRDSEGCLSFPEIFVDVQRSAGIHLTWQDVAGEPHEEDLTGFAARVVQHEMDHLTGVLLVHRMSPVDKIRYRQDLLHLAAEAAER
ncbi:MAG: peptide deformylase [Pseudohongiellaceae bacterium]|jgi:peptide deformylase